MMKLKWVKISQSGLLRPLIHLAILLALASAILNGVLR